MSTPSTAPSPAPSAQTVQDAHQAGYLALQTVTASCIVLCHSGLGPMDPEPDWYQSLKASFEAVKTDAAAWIDNVAPQIAGAIPSAILDYGVPFNSAVSRLNSLVQQSQQPGADQQTVASEVQKLIQGVQQKLQSSQQTVQSAATRLGQFRIQFQADYGRLASSVTEIQDSVMMDQQIIDQIKALTASFYQNIQQIENELPTEEGVGKGGVVLTVAGILLSFNPAGLIPLISGVVTDSIAYAKLKSAIDQYNWDYAQIVAAAQAVHQENVKLAPLTVLEYFATAITDRVEKAVAALQTVDLVWQSLNQQLIDVSRDLDLAGGDIRSIAFEGIVFGMAHDEWTQLQDFARTLQNPPAAPAAQTSH